MCCCCRFTLLTSASALRSQGLGLNSESHSSKTHRFHAGRDELESSYFCSDEVVSCRFLAGRTRELEISRLTNSGVPKRWEIPSFLLRARRNKQLLAQALSVKMLQNAHWIATIGADTDENERHFAENLPKTRPPCTAPRRSPPRQLREAERV